MKTNSASGPFVDKAQHMLHNSNVDMTGATGDIVTFPVLDNKIAILGIGYETMSATGAVNTPAEMALDKTLAGTSTRAQVGTLEATVAASVAINTIVEVDFDTNATANAYSNLKDRTNYYTAVKGDLLHLERTVQGVGGTQSIRPYIIYAVVPDDYPARP